MASRRRYLASVVAMSLVPAGMASAQPVLLQIRPHVGDTLSVRMDQTVEMTGVPRDCMTGYSGTRRGANPEAASRPCSEAARHVTTVTEVFSHAIVLRTSANAAFVLAVTDSIRSAVSSGPSRSVKPKRVAANSGSVRLKVATDGGAEVVDADASDQLRAVFGQMPATLPRKPVAVGEKWVREMRVPVSAEAGGMAFVRATFRLDSLSGDGDVAYISMKGTLSHDHKDGSDSDLDGWLSGTMTLDRRLAWITDTRAVIDVESVVRPAAGGAPMRVRTKITQVLRARGAR